MCVAAGDWTEKDVAGLCQLLLHLEELAILTFELRRYVDTFHLVWAAVKLWRGLVRGVDGG